MDDQQLHDTIEQYLLGTLPPAESARLEADMEQDAALFQQVQIQRLGLMGLQRLAGAELREKFDRWDDDLDDGPPQAPTLSPGPSQPTDVWRWSTIALILLLATGIFWYWVKIRPVQQQQAAEQSEITRRDSLIRALETDIQAQQSTLNNLLRQSQSGADTALQSEIKRLRSELDQKDQTLFEQKKGGAPRNKPMAYAAPKPPKFSKRGGEGVIAQAEDALDNGRYAEAEKLLKGIGPGEAALQKDVTRLLPYALFYQGKYGEAAIGFIQLKTEDKFSVKTSEWYIALCYANEGRTAFAQQALTPILDNPKHPYYDDAVKLRDKLKR